MSAREIHRTKESRAQSETEQQLAVGSLNISPCLDSTGEELRPMVQVLRFQNLRDSQCEVMSKSSWTHLIVTVHTPFNTPILN